MLPFNYLLNAHYPLKGKLGDKMCTLFYFQKWRKYNCNHSFKKKRANVELASMYSNLLFCWTLLGCMLLHVKKQENSMYVSCQIAKKNNTSYTQCKNGSCSSCSEEKVPMVRFPDPPKKTLKQFEEWHVIVSCDQLGETLRVTSSSYTTPINGCSITCNIRLVKFKLAWLTSPEIKYSLEFCT